MGVVAEDSGMPGIAEISFGSRGLPVHGFKIRDHEFRRIRIVAGRRSLGCQEVTKRVVFLEDRRMIYISVNRVVERRNIGGSLDRGMTAQRHDAGARPAEISKQQLQQRTATNDLRSIRVLRPSYRIRKRRGSVGAGVGEDGVRHLEEYVLRATSGPLDHLRRVAA